jgi:hypothetical protein
MTYSFGSDEAQDAIRAASLVMQAISTFEAFRAERRSAMDHLDQQVTEVAKRMGSTAQAPPPSAALLEAWDTEEARFEQLRRLRAALADVVVDARQAVPRGELAADVAANPLKPAPRVLTGLTLQPWDLPQLLRQTERWTAQTLGVVFRDLKVSLGAFRRLIAAKEESEFRQLLGAVDDVLLNL